MLAYLYNKGYKLGIISNQSPGTEERLRSWGLLTYISVVAASAELGIEYCNGRISYPYINKPYIEEITKIGFTSSSRSINNKL